MIKTLPRSRSNHRDCLIVVSLPNLGKGLPACARMVLAHLGIFHSQESPMARGAGGVSPHLPLATRPG
jgi:hypothetical protein